ncbi:hypothetical protein [Empedobacter falsenii]|uniref:Uncharacterized protein n=1 Tax=Empedobacter falsenii TaxID=343874 RepID=A0AAW7DI31_9FLAO|nr:hypothetical protein [Empedobacter falsenii]MDM1551203.1 hypothetical protein [Empedobacter falsenii]
MMLMLNPLPPDNHGKNGMIGGTLCGMLVSIQWQDIFSTILFSLVGALSSFCLSLLLQKFKNENLF